MAMLAVAGLKPVLQRTSQPANVKLQEFLSSEHPIRVCSAQATEDYSLGSVKGTVLVDASSAPGPGQMILVVTAGWPPWKPILIHNSVVC